MRKVLAPLTRMTVISREIAAGNFAVRVPSVTEDEVGQLAQAFNRMAESLEKIQNLRRNLMIDVAHELRTPLTNIRGYLEALNDGVLPPSPEIFSMLQHETLRLVQLTEDVLQLARAGRNAARYTPQNGALDIRIEAGPENVRVDYTNNGGELSHEDLPFIFERFYRGEKSRSRQLGGAGIGLAIVKELVEAHGGRVGAELIGEQVRVWFELSIVPAGRPG